MKFGELVNNIVRNLEANEQENVELVKRLYITLCLTNTECHEGSENFGRQRTYKTHKIKFEKEKKINDNPPINEKEIEIELKEEGKEIRPIKDDKKNEPTNDEAKQKEEKQIIIEEEKGTNTKIYIIILPIIVGLLVLLGVGFLIFKFIFLKKKKNVEEKVNEIYDDILKSKPATNHTLPQSTKRTIRNSRPKIIPFQNYV